ncbi:MAG: cytochrome c1 [Acidisphaera sp.]|nr:cytochrome c1 [Acidisphaera sp.]
MRGLSLPAATLLALCGLAGPARAQESQTPPLVHQHWSFDGILGTFDNAAAQRGFMVYQQVCSACHSMKQMYYRNLTGIGLNDDEIKAIAGSVQVPGPLDENGAPTERPGLPSDHFKSPFANDTAARAANGGALPPDQSVLEKAREGGADYIFAVLTGYSDAPAGMKMQQGMNYNRFFPGNQIAMPQPLHGNDVTYTDGTPSSLDQEAHDVTTFLAFAANPELNGRHQMGVKVVLFLAFLTGLTYAVKRKIWADVH